jgi:hypothetical protein
MGMFTFEWRQFCADGAQPALEYQFAYSSSSGGSINLAVELVGAAWRLCGRCLRRPPSSHINAIQNFERRSSVPSSLSHWIVNRGESA